MNETHNIVQLPEQASMIDRAQLLEELDHMLDTLGEKRRTIIEAYFGFNKEPPISQAEIARRFGVSKTNIRGHLDIAMRKLRHFRTLRHLSAFRESFNIIMPNPEEWYRAYYKGAATVMEIIQS